MRGRLLIWASAVILVAAGLTVLRQPRFEPGVLARYQGGEIRLDEFQRETAEEGSFFSEAQAQRALLRRVDQRLIHLEAKRLEMDATGPAALRRLWQAELGEIEISSDDLVDAFERRRDEFQHPRRVSFDSFRTQWALGTDAARQRLESVRTQFEMSTSPRSIRRILARLPEGVVLERVGAAPCDGSSDSAAVFVACGLERRALSAVFEVDGALGLVRMIREERARDARFEQVTERLEQDLRHEREREARDRYLASLRDRMDLHINHRLLKTLVEQDGAYTPTPAERDEGPPRPPGAEL